MSKRVARVLATTTGRGVHHAVPLNGLSPAMTLLEDFQTAGDWTAGGSCTLAADATNKKTGSQGMKLTTASGVAGTMVKVVNLDLSAATCFRFAVYIADVSKVSSLQLALSNNTGVSVYFQRTITAGAGLLSGWNRINVARAEFGPVGSTPSWSNAFVRLQFKVTPVASQVAVVTFDELLDGVPGQPLALLAFDDTNDNIYTLGFPMLRARGVPATMYAITSSIGTGGKWTAAQLKEAYTAGWDVGNHTVDHLDLTTLTEAQQEAQLSGGKSALDALGLTRASAHVAYPSGLHDANTVTAMNNTGMLTGRTTNVFKTQGLPLGDNQLVPIYSSLSNTVSLATVEGLVDNAKATGGLMIILLHGLVASAPASLQWTIADYTALVDYILAQGMQFLTISELYRLQSAAVTVAHR